LKKIEEGEAAGVPYLKPIDEEIGKDWKPERSDTVAFWEKNTFHTNSGRVRIRALWHYGTYSIYINNPADPTPTYPKFLGPKIAMIPSEVLVFIQNLKEIAGLCPSYAEMLDFLSQD